jgi:hypothetical protein
MLGPRPAGGCIVPCARLSWSARPVTLACVRAIGLQLGCPFDDQAAATYFFGFVSSSHAAEGRHRWAGQVRAGRKRR